MAQAPSSPSKAKRDNGEEAWCSEQGPKASRRWLEAFLSFTWADNRRQQRHLSIPKSSQHTLAKPKTANLTTTARNEPEDCFAKITASED